MDAGSDSEFVLARAFEQAGIFKALESAAENASENSFVNFEQVAMAMMSARAFEVERCVRADSRACL